jgi:16S rRNA (guanine527-N7)-methyltransferase
VEPSISPALLEVLATSQRLGFLGERPLDQVIAHARSFLPPLVDVHGPVLDLGAGGGIPGLVIAHDRPDLEVTLLDRRRTRTDFLARMVARLGWTERVQVRSNDATQGSEQRFSAVSARGFGPPLHTLTVAVAWLVPGGRAVISEPPAGDRWLEVDLSNLDVERLPSASSVSVFRRRPAGRAD